MPRIAVAQSPGTAVEDWPQTLQTLEHLIDSAASQQAELVVLPECAFPAYWMPSPSVYHAAVRAGMPDHGALLERFAGLARQHKLMICCGFIAAEGERLYNSAALLDVDGQLLGLHRKIFLWDFDNDLFGCGHRLAVVDTRVGRVGMLICADNRVPELIATLATRGAQLILQPTAWVGGRFDGQLWNPQAEFMVVARAREFGVAFASASKWGREGETEFVGSSMVCDGSGRVLVQCSQTETATRTADLTLGRPRPVSITASERAALLSPRLPKLRVVVLPPTLSLADTRTRLDALARQGEATTLAVRLRQPGEAGADLLPREAGNLLFLPEVVTPTRRLRGIQVAVLEMSEAETFAPMRRHMLNGVHMFVVIGERFEPKTLQCRASENRVFVLGVSPERAMLFDPRGRLAESLPHQPEHVDAADALCDIVIDPAEAENKAIAHKTNVITGRTPGLYEF